MLFRTHLAITDETWVTLVSPSQSPVLLRKEFDSIQLKNLNDIISCCKIFGV